MKNLFILLACGWLVACNQNASTGSSKADSAHITSESTNSAYGSEEELNFMDGCVDGAKTRLGDTKAYVYCRCIYAQIKAQYGNIDSTALVTLSRDTAQVARMAAKCK